MTAEQVMVVEIVIGIVVLGVVIGWQHYNFTRARYLSSRGYVASRVSGWEGFEWVWIKPSDRVKEGANDKCWTLGDAYKRELLLVERERLNVPEEEVKMPYALGDFTKD